MRLTPFLAAVVVAAACGGSTSGLQQAVDILGDESRFETGLDAGDALADVGVLLQTEGVECRDADPDAARCDALLSASAAAQVGAARVIACTAPGRFEARIALSEHLRAVDADPASAGPPPAPPIC